MSDQEQIAAVIAEHAFLPSRPDRTHPRCAGCDWRSGESYVIARIEHRDHIAEQLIRAGFGSVEAAKAERDAEWRSRLADIGRIKNANERARIRADGLREAADEVHTEARWQEEQRARAFGTERADLVGQHRYTGERLAIVEQILRDRAARLRGEGE
jgi:hypothetical protein